MRNLRIRRAMVTKDSRSSKYLYLIRYSDKAMDRTTEESGFDSRWGQESFLMSITSTAVLEPTQPPALGVKRQGPEADYSSPSSAEAQNCGAVTPFLHVSSRARWLIKSRDNFTFYIQMHVR
jgi:hypothetical protein